MAGGATPLGFGKRALVQRAKPVPAKRSSHRGASPYPFWQVGIGVKGLRPARRGTPMNDPTNTVGSPLTPLPTRMLLVSLDSPAAIIDASAVKATPRAASLFGRAGVDAEIPHVYAQLVEFGRPRNHLHQRVFAGGKRLAEREAVHVLGDLPALHKKGRLHGRVFHFHQRVYASDLARPLVDLGLDEPQINRRILRPDADVKLGMSGVDTNLGARAFQQDGMPFGDDRNGRHDFLEFVRLIHLVV